MLARGTNPHVMCLLQAEHASSAPTPKRSRTAQASAQSDAAAAEATLQQIEAQMRQVATLPVLSMSVQSVCHCAAFFDHSEWAVAPVSLVITVTAQEEMSGVSSAHWLSVCKS